MASAFRHVRIVMILVNGRYDGGRINERIPELSAAKEKIVVPSRPTNSQRRRDGQVAGPREDKISDPHGVIELALAVITGERLKLFAPLWIGKVPWLGDVDIPSAAGHQKIPLAD